MQKIIFELFPIQYLIFSTATSIIEPLTSQPTHLDLIKVFSGCPIIYSLLGILSLASFIIWFYSLMTMKKNEFLPESFLCNIKTLLLNRRYEAALTACLEDNNFAAKIFSQGLLARKHGPQMMMEAIQAEGRCSGITLWQRISFLNEVAIIAPMLGLLGTVLGLFYAFYDNERTQESIAAVFDGLGIAVGTTVAGLIVAILAMIFYTMLKFRLVDLLNCVENELMSLVNLVDFSSSDISKKTN